MTVRELIHALIKLDPTLPVAVWDETGEIGTKNVRVRCWADDSDVEHALIEVDLIARDAEHDEGYPPPCTNPGGHEWPKVEEHERSLCIHCGADGDA